MAYIIFKLTPEFQDTHLSHKRMAYMLNHLEKYKVSTKNSRPDIETVLLVKYSNI